MIDWIADVIYGLKMEYGQPITFRKKTTSSTNYDTGQVTKTVTSKYIENAVPLPLNLRKAFLKTVGINKVAEVASGEFEILVDKVDLDGLVPEANDQVQAYGDTTTIIRTEDYSQAYILIVNRIKGMP